MTILGFSLEPSQWVVLGVAGAVAVLSRKEGVMALLTKLKGLVTGATGKAKGFFSPETDMAQVMEALVLLDAYSDKHALGWTEDLKKMMNAATSLEFDKVSGETD